MDDVTPRLRRKIQHDFSTPDRVSDAIKIVLSAHETERVQAAAVICGEGDIARLEEARDLALLDWRDLLMNAGLAHEDWPAKLDAYLGRQ